MASHRERTTLPRQNHVTENDARDSIVTSFTSSPKCCSRGGCAKYGLFVVNFLVWVAGGALMGVGTWSHIQRTSLAAFDHVTVDIAYLLIGIGAVMFVVSLFGCVGALRENLCLLKSFIIAVVIVFVAQMVAGVLAFVLLDTVEDNMMDFVQRAVTTYHTPLADDNVDTAMDTLQREYSCCGGASYRDWEASPLYNCSSLSSVTACEVPPSCCLEKGEVCSGNRVRQYSEQFAELTIHTRGCIGALMSIFKDNLIVIGLIAFAVGFLQVCSLLMAHCLMRFLVTDGKLSSS
ncbi:tetraspanin-33-like [Littorina saxatilis]|uniref:Tetraspanin n=1 Tax=Littorina saxatilis TaxID=31220 RepID=A0AAN9BMS9_9CAEN